MGVGGVGCSRLAANLEGHPLSPEFVAACGKKYFETQRWIYDKHVSSCSICGAGTASNTVERSGVASNRPASNRKRAGDSVKAGHVHDSPRPTNEVGSKKQRWGRAAYNEYQREYMRKRRTTARAGFAEKQGSCVR